MNKKKNVLRDKWIDIIFFIIMLVIISAVTLTLFSRQTKVYADKYPSDMLAYILEMQGLDSGYSFPYPVLFKLGAFINIFCTPEFSMALATMLLNSLAVVFVKLSLNNLTLVPLKEALGQKSLLAGIIISIVSGSLFFISMLFPIGDVFYLPGIKYHYLGVFTANPFHNATYMAARPFTVLAFFSYALLLDKYEQGFNGSFRRSGSSEAPRGLSASEYIVFAIALLLATMTKPSFTIVLVGAAGLIMLYRLFQSRFKNLIPTVQLGLCFIPTFIALLYQFKGVFVPEEGEEGGIGFCLGDVWREYCDNIPLAVCLAIGFPIVVLIFNYKEIIKNTVYRFSWQIYLMSFAMAFFLYEKGFRKPDFNFAWGYMYGIFFCFVGALVVLLKRTAGHLAVSPETKAAGYGRQRLAILLQWLAYVAHVICGLYYFAGIFRGKMYY
jgi:hypothetical protein